MCVAKKAVGALKCPAYLGGKKGRLFLAETTYFIPAVKSQSCFTVFCEPCLFESEIPAELLLEIQGGENTTRGWAAVIDDIEQEGEEDQAHEDP